MARTLIVPLSPAMDITEVTVRWVDPVSRVTYTAVVAPVRSRHMGVGHLGDTVGWSVQVGATVLPASLPDMDRAMEFAQTHLKRLGKRDRKQAQREAAFEARTLELCEAHEDPRDRGYLPERVWPRREWADPTAPNLTSGGGMTTTNAPG